MQCMIYLEPYVVVFVVVLVGLGAFLFLFHRRDASQHDVGGVGLGGSVAAVGAVFTACLLAGFTTCTASG